MQVDSKKIPPLAYKQTRAILAAGIKQALKDPKLKANYEKLRTEMQVNPKNIPPLAYQQALAILSAGIKQALKDPKLKADYEKWRQEHEEIHMES